jgi:serine/threonine-protein kinase
VEEPATAAARFRFEARVAARLSRRTRHIVQVSDHGEEEGLAYLVMELLEGQTVDTRILRRGCLAPAEAAKVVGQVSRALVEAHNAGFVHRDLKPANIFLTRDEDGALLVKLLDFGIARTIHTHKVMKPFATGEGLVFGTPGYMSPEQATPTSRLDHRCDLWALATVAYEMLTAELPLAGTSTEELLSNLCAGRIIPIHLRAPELPAALGDFFKRAFAFKIDERYTSASELAQAFANASTNSLVSTVPLPGIGTRRRRKHSAVAIVSVATLFGVAAAGAMRGRYVNSAATVSPFGMASASAEKYAASGDVPTLRLPAPFGPAPSESPARTVGAAPRLMTHPPTQQPEPSRRPNPAASVHKPVDRSDVL